MITGILDIADATAISLMVWWVSPSVEYITPAPILTTVTVNFDSRDYFCTISNGRYNANVAIM